MPRKLLFIEQSTGFGGSLTSLARLIEKLDPSRYRPSVVVSQTIHADYLRSYLDAQEIYIDTPQLMTRNHWFGSSVATAFRPFGRHGQVATSAALAGVNLLGPVRQFARRVERHFDAVRFDGVWINNAIGNSHGGAAMLARRWRAPLFCKIQGFTSVSYTDRILASPIDLFIVDSVAVSAPLLQLGVPEERIIPLYCPVDVERFDPAQVPAIKESFASGISPTALTFGIVGQLLEWKGQQVFLEAAKRVFAVHPDSVAVIVGDDPNMTGKRMRELRTLASDLGIGDKVVFTGHRDDIPSILASLDVVVHASIEPEPFGTVIAEAMAMEKPVVAARAGGPPEYVHEGKNGFLADPGDAEQLSESILRLLSDRDLRLRMGKAGRELVCARFSASGYARRVQELFDSAIGHGFPRNCSSDKKSTNGIPSYQTAPVAQSKFDS